MGIYKICPHCGAHLDPGEACDCIAARYASLTPANLLIFLVMWFIPAPIIGGNVDRY